MTLRSITPRASLTTLIALATVLPLCGGCKTVKELYADTVLKGDTITYQQYLDIVSEGAESERTTADRLIARLGNPASVYDRNGKRRMIVYNAFSMTDELKKAEFHFDENERCTKKQLW
jgi:hypothetical protein